MLIGYARISTGKQSDRSQIDALKTAGCEKIYSEEISGTIASRPQLDLLLEYARPGDTLVITRLDRLGRSLKNIIALVAQLESRGLQLKSLKEEIDTSTPTGRLFFHMNAAYAQFEAELARTRTKEGLEAAAKAGNKGGRPRSLTDEQIDQAIVLSGEYSVNKIARTFNVHASTLGRAIKKRTTELSKIGNITT